MTSIAITQQLMEGHHVHAAGCADLSRSKYRGVEVHVYDVASEQELIEEFFSDFLNGPGWDEEYVWTDFIGELHILPCAKGL
jgi:hypothetical protein